MLECAKAYDIARAPGMPYSTARYGDELSWRIFTVPPNVPARAGVKRGRRAIKLHGNPSSPNTLTTAQVFFGKPPRETALIATA